MFRERSGGLTRREPSVLVIEAVALANHAVDLVKIDARHSQTVVAQNSGRCACGCALSDAHGPCEYDQGARGEMVHVLMPNVMYGAKPAPYSGRCWIFWSLKISKSGLQSGFTAHILDKHTVIDIP